MEMDQPADVPEDEILPGYSLRSGVRGKYSERYAAGTNLLRLDPDVAAVFPTADLVNRALRALAGIIQDQGRTAA